MIMQAMNSQVEIQNSHGSILVGSSVWDFTGSSTEAAIFWKRCEIPRQNKIYIK